MATNIVLNNQNSSRRFASHGNTVPYNPFSTHSIKAVDRPVTIMKSEIQSTGQWAHDSTAKFQIPTDGHITDIFIKVEVEDNGTNTYTNSFAMNFGQVTLKQAGKPVMDFDYQTAMQECLHYMTFDRYTGLQQLAQGYNGGSGAGAGYAPIPFFFSQTCQGRGEVQIPPLPAHLLNNTLTVELEVPSLASFIDNDTGTAAVNNISLIVYTLAQQSESSDGSWSCHSIDYNTQSSALPNGSIVETDLSAMRGALIRIDCFIRPTTSMITGDPGAVVSDLFYSKPIEYSRFRINNQDWILEEDVAALVADSIVYNKWSANTMYQQAGETWNIGFLTSANFNVTSSPGDNDPYVLGGWFYSDNQSVRWSLKQASGVACTAWFCAVQPVEYRINNGSLRKIYEV